MVVVGALSAAVVLVGCSDDGSDGASSDRGTLTFVDAPEGSTDLGLCDAYELEDVKALLGGEQSFKELAPSAIGAEGDPVTGEACGWDRTEENGDGLSLRIEVRDYGDDVDGLTEQFDDLRKVTADGEEQGDLGDEAFSAETADSTLLQVRSGAYLLTASSRSQGGLEPVGVDQLRFLAAEGLAQLP